MEHIVPSKWQNMGAITLNTMDYSVEVSEVTRFLTLYIPVLSTTVQRYEHPGRALWTYSVLIGLIWG